MPVITEAHKLNAERRKPKRRAMRLEDCSVKTAVDVISGKWKPLILFQLKDGRQRYGDLRLRLSEASEKVLVQQLRQLEADGIVERTVYPEVPPRVDYALTPYGQTLSPILQLLADWGERHKTIRASAKVSTVESDKAQNLPDSQNA